MNLIIAYFYFKNGFKGIKNGHKTWLKFLYCCAFNQFNYYYHYTTAWTILSVATGNMSQKVATVILL
ncbi:hypothetical protein [Staphylococcus borealis]|uniref:hypothetical protein n=1 Tax=Staphylococcus borealis TaxID=2742203 RepID=UPI001E5A7FE9|nr:hypothetical protein [Staphylococcus borealis]